MKSHALAKRLLGQPDIEVRCFVNTEKFGVDDVGDWNGEFVYITIHHCEVDNVQ